jgi:hypothetical protein
LEVNKHDLERLITQLLPKASLHEADLPMEGEMLKGHLDMIVLASK